MAWTCVSRTRCAGALILAAAPTVQTRKPGPRELSQLPRGPHAGEWQGWDSNPGLVHLVPEKPSSVSLPRTSWPSQPGGGGGQALMELRGTYRKQQGQWLGSLGAWGWGQRRLGGKGAFEVGTEERRGL